MPMASFFKRSVVVSQSKAIIPNWTVIQLDDDSTFEELFKKIKVRMSTNLAKWQAS